MITYVIIPETGTIVVEDDMDDIAKFTYNEGWDGNWEVFDSADINGPPVASGLASQYDVWIWVHSIDPDTFRKEI
jgi:hypothetical protein